MKVTLFMAQSMNGMIARENYDEDFLSHDNWKMFVKFTEEIGCLVIGRKTYEEVKKWKDYNFDSVRAHKIIVSHQRKFKHNLEYAVASSPKNALNYASKIGVNHVLVCGGGLLNAAFMKQGLIDELIINNEPYVLGKGIRTFSEEKFEYALKTLQVRKYASGIVQVKYKVLK